jgi:hypothetical protein
LHLRPSSVNIGGVALELASRHQAGVRGLSPAARPAGAGLLAPCLSFLCFLHCAGTALIAPWIPAAAALFGASWLEWPLLGVSGASAVWLLRRVRARAGAWLAVGLALSCAAWGLGTDRERAMQAGLLGVAAAQLILLAVVRRRAIHDACCGSEPVGSDGDCCAEED